MNRPPKDNTGFLFTLGALFLLAWLLLGCDTVDLGVEKTRVEITRAEVTPDGTHGRADVSYFTPDRSRLVVTFNDHNVVLDTVVVGRGEAPAVFSMPVGWGHPPMPFGDCWRVTISHPSHGDRTDDRCNTERLPD